MFEQLSHRITQVFGQLGFKQRLHASHIEEGIREIRLALLEANVSLRVVKAFTEDLRGKILGEEVIATTTPTQTFIKRVHEALVGLLGVAGGTGELRLLEPTRITAVLFCGLQGCGKTTTIGKIAYKYRQKRDILTVSLDMHRPAAGEQLQLLSKQAGVDYYNRGSETNLRKIIKKALSHASLHRHNLVLFDTAGRTQIDSAMMQELQHVHKALDPSETFLVCDAMTGQTALSIAEAFKKAVRIDSLCFTKADAAVRGGAILSVQYVVGVPIKFMGTGEKITDMDVFHADRMANRLLGMGDIISLAEKAEATMDTKKSQQMAQKLESKQFDLQDFLDQLMQIEKMGSMKSLMKYLPGMASNLNQDALNNDEISQMKAIIRSMTPKERKKPFLINSSRRKRIANGSGKTILEVNHVLKKFEELKKLMKKMKNPGKMKAFMKERLGKDMDFSHLESLQEGKN